MINQKFRSFGKIHIYILVITSVILLSSCKHSGRNISGYRGLNSIMKFAFINPSKPEKVSKEAMNDLLSLKYSLFTLGIQYTNIPANKIASENLFNYDVIILPYAASNELQLNEIDIIRAAVIEGSNLVFDGNSPLDTAMNIILSKEKISVAQAINTLFPKTLLYWNDSITVNYIDTIPKNYSPLCIESKTKKPIAISGNIGKGKFIYYATLFDEITDKGYSKFPFLFESMNKFFGPTTLAERSGVELFFDPGMRDGSISIDDLAKQWRKNGVKRIYAAGWYFDFGYDYESLVEACHANGILIYCWLEPPMVSKGFWDEHPEWREKTAYLKDAKIDWRYLMNLADAECRKAVFDAVGHLLTTYDWDGVDLAELYFEPSPDGPANAEEFTPMNDIVRDEFKNSAGFDPFQLFDIQSPHYWRKNKPDWKKFVDYRKSLCFRLKTYFLDYLQSVEIKKNNFEIILTVIDVSLTPQLSDYIAEDTKNTLLLYNKYGCTLQIEDPSNCWGSTPSRYEKLGEFYRKYIKDDDKLIFDCNVVNSHVHGYGGFPAEKPTGEEIRQIVFNMQLNKSRSAFYAEDAINENDFQNISSVLARVVEIKEISDIKWEVNTPFTIKINAGAKNVKFTIDGEQWNAFDAGKIIVPVGKHKIKFDTLKNESAPYHLKTISGELQSAVFNPTKFGFNYIENINYCYAIIDKQPIKLEIDGIYEEPDVIKSESDYTLKLPKGNHTVIVYF